MRTISYFSVGSAVSDAPTESIQACLSDWNDYIIHNIADTTDTTDTTNTTNTTDTNISFFNKIRETTLEGRSLELFFPLFLIAWKCGVLDEIIKTAEELVKNKKEEDMSESRDISFINFLASKTEDQQTNEFVPLRDLVKEFKSEDEEWITSEWIGRALKRLGLIIEKRRIAKGREVKINWKKAKEKIKIFQ